MMDGGPSRSCGSLKSTEVHYTGCATLSQCISPWFRATEASTAAQSVLGRFQSRFTRPALNSDRKGISQSSSVPTAAHGRLPRACDAGHCSGTSSTMRCRAHSAALPNGVMYQRAESPKSKVKRRLRFTAEGGCATRPRKHGQAELAHGTVADAGHRTSPHAPPTARVSIWPLGTQHFP